MDIWSEIMATLKTPFVGPIDLEDLFLIVGVVLVFIAIWLMILYHVRLAASEL